MPRNRPLSTIDECIVEVRRLTEIVTRQSTEIGQLRNQNDQLNSMLGQAQAGMELADLIKRMIG